MLSAATTSPAGAANRRRDRRQPRLELVDRGRELLAPDDVELGSQASRVGDRVRRQRLAAARAGIVARPNAMNTLPTAVQW